MDDLEGRAAIITGGANGIGCALALAFAAEGMHIVVADLDAAAAEEAVAAIEERGVRALVVPTDVMDRAAVARLADAAFEEFGDVALLCNNAGVPGRGGIVGASGDDWDWVLGVNLQGVVNGLLAFLPRLLAQERPAHIVNTSSMGGLLPYATAGVYNASKFAVFGLSEALRLELEGTSVGVTTLCPASVETRFSEGGRMRPQRFGGPTPRSDRPAGLVPIEAGPVAVRTVRAVREGHPYVFTHENTRERLEGRFAQILDGLDV